MLQPQCVQKTQPVHTGINLQSSIAAFPTSGQPVLDTTAKGMLLSLQSSLIVDFLRQQLKTETKALTNNKITYKWCHPATILATHNGASHMICNFKVGMNLLHSWGIIQRFQQLTTTLPTTPSHHNMVTTAIGTTSINTNDCPCNRYT